MTGKFWSINPATGEALEEFDSATESEADDAVARSRAASQIWREKDVSERAKYLTKTAEVLAVNETELSRAITLEMGKPIKESLAEVKKCAHALNYFADNAGKMLEDEIVKATYSKSYITFDPLGVVFAIMPWNFPFWQVIRCAAPA